MARTNGARCEQCGKYVREKQQVCTNCDVMHADWRSETKSQIAKNHERIMRSPLARFFYWLATRGAK